MTDTRSLEPSPDAVRRMVEVLAPRLPGVAARTAERAVAEIPEYGVLDVAEVLEGIQRDLGLAVAALLEARTFTPQDRETMSLIGDTRAVQRLPLEGMLRVYRMTVDEIFRELWAAAEIGELQPFEVLQLTSRVWSYAGPLMDLATAAYRARELELALADSDRRTGLVHELLLSPSAAPASVAAAIGLDPLREVLAFRARTTTPDGPAALLSALKLPGVLDGGIAVPYEGDVIGLAPRRPTLPDAPGVVVGLGPVGPLAALPSSFALATRTVETAAAFGLHGVLTLDRVPLHAMTRAEAELAGLLHARCVRPVLDAPEVLDTVRAFLAHELAAEATADALAVHANTVRNRLHRYEALTGLSLRRLDDLVQLRLALLHQELTGAP
ncbi:helix-turn-helix domain-containing protein [Paraconexibacter algicola]|uniref:Uncharacterized protein n=1 Tax=Paraconexibacter algicola TaxID=2133960 RepID=A0A2T4UJN0_9ACTN|nr:helix-turn-helix domain-containing protein [Paraconexibacter algicola]PTL59425.1 hypothetical protein C7Y72_07060 [Paraconexibacter algicola]